MKNFTFFTIRKYGNTFMLIIIYFPFKGFYSFARSASWIIFSTSAILFAPVIFEVERAQMEEMQKQQHRQVSKYRGK